MGALGCSPFSPLGNTGLRLRGHVPAYLNVLTHECIPHCSLCGRLSFSLLTPPTWLASSCKRINYKLATLTYKALASEFPACLSSLLTPYGPVRTLRSSNKLLLQRFTTYKTNFGSRAFRSAAPSVWNSLPYSVRASLYSIFL